MSSSERRKRKLIEPRIQKRFVLIFLSTTALAIRVQSLVVVHLLLRVADRLPNDGIELRSELVGTLASSLSLTLLLLTPLTLVVGIASTHKIVGPLYRFRVYLTQLAAGERPQPCRIREDDELQDFCELLNRATGPLRERDAAGGPAAEEAA
jgi:hypothetical protein